MYCMKKVWITPGCIACGSCAYLAPEVFEVTTKSHVKQDVQLEPQADKIKKAAASCPVQVINYSE